MNISLLKYNVGKYKNPSQKIRVISEAWTEEEIFCPNCGGKLEHKKNNSPVGDFKCIKCNEEFELKTKKII